MSQASDSTKTELTRLARDWVAAELRAETAFLDQTLMDDFVGVGPPDDGAEAVFLIVGSAPLGLQSGVKATRRKKPGP